MYRGKGVKWGKWPVGMWTCCYQTDERAPGCSRRPHLCKEVMISIRADGAKPVRIENIDMSIVRSLNISIFPGSAADAVVRVRVTRQLADMLHSYFSISPDHTTPTTTIVPTTTNPTTTNGGSNNNNNNNSNNNTTAIPSSKSPTDGGLGPPAMVAVSTAAPSASVQRTSLTGPHNLSTHTPYPHNLSIHPTNNITC